MDQSSDKKWWRRERWRYAGGAFLLGVAYSLTATLVGLEARIGVVDVTLIVSFFLELTFAVFGFLIGFIVEVRRGERSAAAQAQERLQELADLRERLAQTEKLASLGQLASTVAHEVRNPLAILRSMTQNLAEELSEQDRVEGARAVCQDMIEEIDRLANVTSRLVDFARPVALRLSSLNVAELARRVRLLTQVGLERQDVLFELKGTGDLELAADADLLCQLLLGLFENAVTASPRGGTVALGWRRVEPEQAVELWVEDQGEGVPEELRERIFEPFFTTRSDGHGLGLAVARHLAEAHGGQLWVEDARPIAKPPGASFFVRLPMSRTQE